MPSPIVGRREESIQTQPTETLVLVRDDWASREYGNFKKNIEPIHYEIENNRGCDCVRQLCAEVCCGIFCLPCACTRLIGYCTGCLNPERITVIPGLECCSSSNGCSNRGYQHKSYTRKQDFGSGFSRRALDIMNVIVTPIVWGGGAVYYAYSHGLLHSD